MIIDIADIPIEVKYPNRLCNTVKCFFHSYSAPLNQTPVCKIFLLVENEPLRGLDRYSEIVRFGCDYQLRMYIKNRSHLKYVFSAVIGKLIFSILLDNDGVLLHAGYLTIGGKNILVIGPSGAGKSTLLKNTGIRTAYHDDKVAIRICDSGLYAYGTPLLKNSKIPGIYHKSTVDYLLFIKKDNTKDSLNVISAPEYVYELVSNVSTPPELVSGETIGKIARNAFGIAEYVCGYRLLFRKDCNLKKVFRDAGML